MNAIDKLTHKKANTLHSLIEFHFVCLLCDPYLAMQCLLRFALHTVQGTRILVDA